MNRFRTHSHTSASFIWRLLSISFMVVFLILFFQGIHNVYASTNREQAKSLENAIRRSVVQCYVVEGTYPPSLEYLTEHYGITYDSDKYYVDYTAIGSNLMPDITIIELTE